MSRNAHSDKHQGVLVDLGFGWRVALTPDQTRFALQCRVWSETRTRQWKTVRTSVNRCGLLALVAAHGLDTSLLGALPPRPPRIVAAPFRTTEAPVIRWALDHPSGRQRRPVAGVRSGPQSYGRAPAGGPPGPSQCGGKVLGRQPAALARQRKNCLA